MSGVSVGSKVLLGWMGGEKGVGGWVRYGGSVDQSVSRSFSRVEAWLGLGSTGRHHQHQYEQTPASVNAKARTYAQYRIVTMIVSGAATLCRNQAARSSHWTRGSSTARRAAHV